MGCCEGSASGAKTGEETGVALAIQEKFAEFMKATSAPGTLDAKTKRAIAIALSVLARCEPCIQSHIKKAREMGFSQEQIDEAAWLAIAFGGCSAMMFYNAHRLTT